MLDKIKALLRMKEEISHLHAELKQATAESQRMAEELKLSRTEQEHLKKALDESRKQTESYLKYLQERLREIRVLGHEFRQELTEFKAFKSKLSESLHKDLIAGFREELGKHAERLQTDSRSFNELRAEVMQIAKTTNTAHAEVRKLIDIAQQIKKADFELEKFAKKIFDADREKLELLKQIDTLERLIAKQRRDQPR
ncbi:hypothetical protein J4464_06325 [Candidatus Woesearchaeota archaeon]|nr:hypothetical protein [Candidatus Woesearchaeota archaeon]